MKKITLLCLFLFGACAHKETVPFSEVLHISKKNILKSAFENKIFSEQFFICKSKLETFYVYDTFSFFKLDTFVTSCNKKIIVLPQKDSIGAKKAETLYLYNIGGDPQKKELTLAFTETIGNGCAIVTVDTSFQKVKVVGVRIGSF